MQNENREQILQELRKGVTIQDLSDRYGVGAATIRVWKNRYIKDGETKPVTSRKRTDETPKPKPSNETPIVTQVVTVANETPKPKVTVKQIGIALMIVALLSVSAFQFFLTSSAFIHLGTLLSAQIFQQIAYLGALGFCLGGFSLGVFVQNDEWNDSDYQLVLLFVTIDMCLNLLYLVDLTKPFSVIALGFITSVATPYIFYALSKNLTALLRRNETE